MPLGFAESMRCLMGIAYHSVMISNLRLLMNKKLIFLPLLNKKMNFFADEAYRFC